MEVEKRDDKKAHPYAWNADLMWRLLRLADSYREAVEEFYEAAVRADDKTSLLWFNMLSGRDVEGDDNYTKDFVTKNEPTSRLDAMQRWKSTIPGDTIDLFVLERNPDEPMPYYDAFMARYGDIIRFPVHPDNLSPPALYLNAVWNLRPTIFAGPRYVQLQHIAAALPFGPNYSAAVKSFSIAINTHFKKKKVLKEIEKYVDAIYADVPEPMDLRPRWDEMDVYAKVWAMRKERDGKGQQMGAQRIGDALAPPMCPTQESRKEWAAGKIEYVEKTLMPFFERAKPTPKPTGGISSESNSPLP